MTNGRTTPSPADAALVAAIATGSEDALAALYDRHAGAIHATALRLTGDRQAAEDVVQEVFLTLWNRADRFDPTAGSLLTWLGTMARNRSIDRHRAASRRPQLVALGDDGDEGAADASLERAAERLRDPSRYDATDPVAVLEADEARAAINAALAEMPEPEREVILLAYRDELTQREISERLGSPLGTVKTRTRRALARLRCALADVYGPQLAPVPLPQADVRAATVSRPATEPGPGGDRGLHGHGGAA